MYRFMLPEIPHDQIYLSEINLYYTRHGVEDHMNVIDA
jgi:hypothetical protein